MPEELLFMLCLGEILSVERLSAVSADLAEF